MKSYAQFCPVATAAEIIGERWTPLLIRELVSGSQSFSEIRMGVTRMSPTLLSTRLKTLEKAGIIIRVVTGSNIRYELTKAGDELRPVIMALGVWGQRWARSDLSKTHLDPSYLMWDIRRRVDTSLFPKKRCVILFEFVNYTAKQRKWWLVFHKGEADLCRTDPGYEVQLHVSSELKTLIQIWMGDLSLSKALRDKTLVLKGNAVLKRDMKSWFTLSSVADIKAMKIE